MKFFKVEHQGKYIAIVRADSPEQVRWYALHHLCCNDDINQIVEATDADRQHHESFGGETLDASRY